MGNRKKAKAAPAPAAPERETVELVGADDIAPDQEVVVEIAVAASDEEAASDAKVANAEKFQKAAAKQHRRTASADALADYERASAGQVRKYAQLPDDKPLTLRFADGDAFLDGEIAVGLDELIRQPSGHAVYAKPVVFEPAQASADVTEAWLIGGKSAVRARIHGGLRVGGGRQAAIPANHLRF